MARVGRRARTRLQEPMIDADTLLVKWDKFIDERIAFEKRNPLRSDYPNQGTVRKALLQTCDRRKSVDDVPHGA